MIRWFSFFLLVLAQMAMGALNLIPNPGLEGPAGDRLPAHWEKAVTGISPKYATDATIKHSGLSSVRMEAVDVTRSYVRSDSVQVAPGERISASIWVRCKDVATGHVMLVAQFAGADGHGQVLAKFDTANTQKSEWQQVSGTLVVPPNVSTMRLRMGFSYSRGTIWVDDAKVWAQYPLVARMEQLNGRLSPALSAMPVTILNRGHVQGSAIAELIFSRGKVSENDTSPVIASPEIIKEAEAAAHQSGSEEHRIGFALNSSALQTISVPITVRPRGRGVLYLVLYRGTTPIFGGYQDVRIPPPLVLEPPSPTDWVIEEGSPRFDGQIDLALPEAMRVGGHLQIKVVDQQNRVWGSWNSRHDLIEGINEYSIAAPQAKIGKYRIVAEFIPPRGKPIKAEEHWEVIPRAKAEVTINAAGYPVYDGRAIFPLGMFNGTLWDGLQAGGFTVSHAYNAVNTVAFEPPDDLAAQRFLDESEKHGMKALFLIPRGYVFAGQWDAFRRRVQMFKNSPALLAWDEEEGIARGDLSLAGLAKMVQIIREEDPHHPIMIGDSRDIISRMTDRSDFFPVKLMDMGMWWWYPFPLKNLAAGALEGDEGTRADELALPTFLTKANTNKPIWVGIQSYKKGKDSSYPTPTEYRAQAYAAICAGAKGLMWYGGGVSGGVQVNPQAAHWKYLQELVREIRSNADFWMEPDTVRPTIEPAGALVSAIIKKHDGRSILVAVNRSVQPVNVTFVLHGFTGQAHLSEGHRSVQIVDGKLNDQLSGLGVHLYELP